MQVGDKNDTIHTDGDTCRDIMDTHCNIQKTKVIKRRKNSKTNRDSIIWGQTKLQVWVTTSITMSQHDFLALNDNEKIATQQTKGVLADLLVDT